MKIYIRANESADETKYGIFSVRAEVRERDFDNAWSFTEGDVNPKCLALFDTLDDANRAFSSKKYESDVTKTRSNGGYYFYRGTVYFIAEAKRDDEDEPWTLNNVYPGDGYVISEI